MMELEVFPEEMRRRVLEIGQVLRMEMFPEDSVRPKKGKISSIDQLTNQRKAFYRNRAVSAFDFFKTV